MKDNLRRTEITIRDTEEAQLLGQLETDLPTELYKQVQDKLESRQSETIRGTKYSLNHGLGRVGYLTALMNTVENHKLVLEACDRFVWGCDEGTALYLPDGERIFNDKVNHRILVHLAKMNGWTEFQFAWWKVRPW